MTSPAATPTSKVIHTLRSALYQARGRSYWEARYADGRVYQEGDCEWYDLPRTGLVAVRLVCPNGDVGTIDGALDERAFQLKLAVTGTGGPHQVLAQLVGAITSPDGDCTLYAWDTRTRTLRGPLPDHFHRLRYEQIGPLGPAAMAGSAHG